MNGLTCTSLYQVCKLCCSIFPTPISTPTLPPPHTFPPIHNQHSQEVESTENIGWGITTVNGLTCTSLYQVCKLYCSIFPTPTSTPTLPPPHKSPPTHNKLYRWANCVAPSPLPLPRLPSPHSSSTLTHTQPISFPQRDCTAVWLLTSR